MTTKNEYIASIMLEAADLLKNDNMGSAGKDYYEHQLLVDSVNESAALCEQLGRVIDKYESNIYYSLNESIGSTIWEGIKKLCKKIREWWKRFKNKITGKEVAKEDGEAVDPQKASKVVDEIDKAYTQDKSMDDIDVEDIKKKVKKGDSMPNYDSLSNKVNKVANKIEKETDAEKAARARESLNLLTKINNEITKTDQLFLLPASKEDGNVATIYDEKGRVVKQITDSTYHLGNPEAPRKKSREIIRYRYDDKNREENYWYPEYTSKYTEYGRSGKPSKTVYSNELRNMTAVKNNLTGEFRTGTHKKINTTKGYDGHEPIYVNEKGEASNKLPRKKKAANRRKQAAKEAARARGKNMNETVEFLYDQALLAETVEEFDTIMEAIDVLEIEDMYI